MANSTLKKTEQSKKTELFFVSCPLGLEKDLAKEIFEFWPYLLETNARPHGSPLEIEAWDRGGILIRCPFVLGVQINYFSKIALRVLYRLGEWKVHSLARMFERLQSLRPNLNLMIGSKPIFRFEIQAQKSKINNEKRIAEIANKALNFSKEFTKELNNKGPSQAVLYIRMMDDLCTVSLDTTGEHLHFRGWRKLQGAAPLRENLAAWAIRRMIDNVPTLKGLEEIQWIDPMAGSGTLMMEALLLYQPSSLRTFSFEEWKATPLIFKSEHKWKNYEFPKTISSNYIAIDRDPKSLERLSNLQPFFEKAQAKWTVLPADFWSLVSLEDHPARYVIINPPYGERLERTFSLQNLVEHAIQIFSPQKLGIFFPTSGKLAKISDLASDLTADLASDLASDSKRYIFNIKAHSNIKVHSFTVKKIPLNQSGIPIYFWMFERI